MMADLTPFRPSNGSHGSCFEAEFCDRCVHENWRTEKWCEIHSLALGLGIEDEGYPGDTWVWLAGSPTCLAFRERGSGPTNEELPPVDPNQCDLFEQEEVIA